MKASKLGEDKVFRGGERKEIVRVDEKLVSGKITAVSLYCHFELALNQEKHAKHGGGW